MRAERLIPNVTRRRSQSEIRELVGEAILDVEDIGLIVRPLPLASGTPSWWWAREVLGRDRAQRSTIPMIRLRARDCGRLRLGRPLSTGYGLNSPFSLWRDCDRWRGGQLVDRWFGRWSRARVFSGQLNERGVRVISN